VPSWFKIGVSPSLWTGESGRLHQRRAVVGLDNHTRRVIFVVGEAEGTPWQIRTPSYPATNTSRMNIRTVRFAYSTEASATTHGILVSTSGSSRRCHTGPTTTERTFDSAKIKAIVSSCSVHSYDLVEVMTNNATPVTDSKQIKAHCNACVGITNHVVIHRHTKAWNDDIDEQHPVSGGDEYLLMQCAGCDAVHLQHDNWFSEHWDENGAIIDTVYYPPAISRRRPSWLKDPQGPFYFGGTEIEKLLEEIYSALQNDSRRLAAMGIRALLELIMIQQVGDGGQIGKNVDKFLEQGFVAKINQDTFRFQLIEAGHAAMHRQYVPERVDIEVLMQITESLIEAIYVQPAKAKRLGKIPARTERFKPITDNELRKGH
jgi:hypothetical protein